MKSIIKAASGGLFLLIAAGAQADQQILDDLIVDGSICAGFDCVNGESFGFDTLRLKENNLRIKFQDTSTSASFPSNDWQITANDSSNGGQDKFSIDDITNSRTPFTIEASAPSHSLYVDDGGRLGLGTSQPVVDVHVVSGNTPTLRLQQDGSSGFTAQTWDVAGNEANFFVRDATNGSTLPFKIKPGAPDNALYVAADGNLGLNTTSPSASVHVRRTSVTNGTAQILVEEASTTAAARTLLKLTNNGNTKISLENSDSNTEWSVANPGSSFRVSQQGSGEVELEIFDNGNVTINGTLTENSDMNAKTAITEVDPDEILKRVAALPVAKWEYKDALGEAHIGPMAQDFYAAFQLGGSETGISTMDTSGVALVAIKALVAKNQSLEARIEQLQRENQAIMALQQAQYEQLKAMLVNLQLNTRPKGLLATSLE